MSIDKKIDYYVVRTYSGTTTQKELWKVLNRPIRDKVTAENWLEYCEETEPNSDKYEFFIVSKET